jgi:SMI1-KNR4 cell-wall
MAIPESLEFSSPKPGAEPEVVTPELLAKVEGLLGVKLPESYVALMKRQNGGYIRQHLIKIDEPVPSNLAYYVEDGRVSVVSFNGISLSTERELTLADNTYLLNEWGLPSKLVLIDGDGHTWIALDYRKTDTDPPVVFVVSDDGQALALAPNFAEFLARLVPEEEVYPDGH